MSSEYWLEKDGSNERTGKFFGEFEALAFAKLTYPDDKDPDEWVYKNEFGVVFVLVRGGPGGEEFTWVPRD